MNKLFRISVIVVMGSVFDGAAGHVAVFSVKVYDSQVRSGRVPPNVDIPILAREFPHIA